LNNHSTVAGKENEMTRNDLPMCHTQEVHGEVVQRIKGELPDTATLYELSDFFKIFGDSTRVSILFVIDRGEICVCDIAEVLGMTKSAVSHQLKVLRQAKLISYRKSGKNVFYSLADDHVKDIIEKALEHIKE
jgi:ArsR family transcriptional regulator